MFQNSFLWIDIIIDKKEDMITQYKMSEILFFVDMDTYIKLY